jgi:hypothetical protein
MPAQNSVMWARNESTELPEVCETTDGHHLKVSVSNSLSNPLPVVECVDTIRIATSPTISAGVAYAAGDALGGRMELGIATLPTGNAAIIEKVVIVDDDQELAPIDVVFFDGLFNPTADNSPFDPDDADLQDCLGYIDIAATDYASFNDNAVACKTSGLRMPFEFTLSGDMVLAYQMVIREAHTYTATDDITIVLTIRRLQ